MNAVNKQSFVTFFRCTYTYFGLQQINNQHINIGDRHNNIYEYINVNLNLAAFEMLWKELILYIEQSCS